MVIIVSAILLPFNFTAGIFGMNNGIPVMPYNTSDPDAQPPSYWDASLWITGCVVTVLCIGLSILWVTTRKFSR